MRSRFARVAETTRAPDSGPELLDLDKLSARDGRNDELGNALLGFDSDAILTQVDQDDFDFAPVIRVDRAWRIYHRKPFIECAATSSPYLPLKSRRYFDRDSSRDSSTVEGRKRQRFVQRRH